MLGTVAGVVKQVFPSTEQWSDIQARLGHAGPPRSEDSGVQCSETGRDLGPAEVKQRVAENRKYIGRYRSRQAK